jgi:hypothetical protein
MLCLRHRSGDLSMLKALKVAPKQLAHVYEAMHYLLQLVPAKVIVMIVKCSACLQLGASPCECLGLVSILSASFLASAAHVVRSFL